MNKALNLRMTSIKKGLPNFELKNKYRQLTSRLALSNKKY